MNTTKRISLDFLARDLYGTALSGGCEPLEGLLSVEHAELLLSLCIHISIVVSDSCLDGKWL